MSLPKVTVAVVRSCDVSEVGVLASLKPSLFYGGGPMDTSILFCKNLKFHWWKGSRRFLVHKAWECNLRQNSDQLSRPY